MKKKSIKCHGCPELKLLNDFLISVQLLIKELVTKKIVYSTMITQFSLSLNKLGLEIYPDFVEIYPDFGRNFPDFDDVKTASKSAATSRTDFEENSFFLTMH